MPRYLYLTKPRPELTKNQVPLDSFKYDSGKPKLYKQDNGVIREFCDNCGAYICEYGVSLLLQGPTAFRSVC